MSSTVEAKLGASFINTSQAIAICATLMEMGHKQPQMSIQTDNLTAMSIITNTMLPKVTKAMDYNSIGSGIKNNKNNSATYGAQEQQTQQTTRPSITVPLTIRPWDQKSFNCNHNKTIIQPRVSTKI